MANIVKRGENSYLFTVSLGKDARGKYPRETMTYIVEGKFTPKQLEEHLKGEYLKFKNQVLSGNYVRPSKMNFTDFVSEWEKKYASKLAGTTYGNHQRKLTDHITPVIGHMEMIKINELIILDLLDNLQRKDGKTGELSFHSKQDIYRTLQSIFKYAVKWKVITDNPMENVDKPKAADTEYDQKELQVYDEEEISQLMELVQNEPDHWRIIFTLALAAGLRRGELLGLEWKNIDFVNNQIEIKQTIVLTKAGPHIKRTKTKSSKRVVTLPISMMNELKVYRKKWVKEKLKYADIWEEEEHEWVFCNEKGHHLHPSSPSNKWRKFLIANEFKYIRLHDLRHTSASILIAQGVHAKIISERLGHSDISITMNTYGHAFKSADRAAADKLEMLFSPQSKSK
ncbi:tyrosine-type recombinase/integrase [Lysinibacillus pakistanensis]|uniref:Site-specific integrase n=1 Tax=Lysinibacillus pakistanensis TaxID=759811 RepID=A0AAX3WZX1_9BACI|nr:site-specific integrase [Lysinibacillus pakistanensis]MDM5231438.1 site-specific integrase [Lysinibacillus pakistanensis]WHY46985.1 site-specific integrase [Lysinibacillus pakistanensis]WHY51997.1 site-specific integrase [Lysinibacillus pakistanensis]